MAGGIVPSAGHNVAGLLAVGATVAGAKLVSNVIERHHDKDKDSEAESDQP